MKVIWTPTASYRGFFSCSTHTATVVSSNLVPGAVGKSIPGGLTVVTDDNGVFCDLELELLPECHAPNPIFPLDVTKVTGPLETVIDKRNRAHWLLDQASGHLTIYTAQGDVESWFELGTRGVIIGTLGKATLGAIIIHDAIEDPAGRIESAWLDEIESVRRHTS